MPHVLADQDIIAPLKATGEMPVVRTIGADDLKDVLRKGFDDFMAMPT
jgi:uncharacterized membrane protein